MSHKVLSYSELQAERDSFRAQCASLQADKAFLRGRLDTDKDALTRRVEEVDLQLATWDEKYHNRILFLLQHKVTVTRPNIHTYILKASYSEFIGESLGAVIDAAINSGRFPIQQIDVNEKHIILTRGRLKSSSYGRAASALCPIDFDITFRECHEATLITFVDDDGKSYVLKNRGK